MPIKNETQSIILDKFKKYFSIMSKKKPSCYFPEDIQNQNDTLEAACSGFVALWFYYIHRNKKKYFYNTIMAPIFNWNKKQNTLSTSLKKKIEYSFSCIVWLHADSPSFEKAASIENNIQQSDYHILINIIKQSDYPKLRKEYEIAFVWKNKEFIDFVKTLLPYKLIRLANNNHAIGLFFDTKHYTLFDPNGFKISNEKYAFEKQVSFKETDGLLANIQNAFFYTPNSSVIGLTISVFDSIHNELPSYMNPTEKIKLILDNRLATNKISYVNAANSYDNANALYFCAKRGDLNSVKLLLNRETNPTQVTTESYTSLHIAIQNGHCAVVKELLDSPLGNALLNTRLNNGDSPLCIAVANNRINIVRLLLQHGAFDSYGPIHIAAEEGFFAIVELLLNSNTGQKLLDVPLEDGRTALSIAAENGHIKIVKLLLQHNSKAKLPNNWPTTMKLFKANESEYYIALQQAISEIAKTDDIDNNNLIKIRTAYLLIASKIKNLNSEIETLSESDFLLPQHKIGKLNTITQEIEDLQTFVYFKTYNINTQDKAKRDSLVFENEKTFTNLFDKIEHAKTSENQTKESVLTPIYGSPRKRKRV